MQSEKSDIIYDSNPYKQFLKEYEIFSYHHKRFNRLCTICQKWQGRSTRVDLLYEKVIEENTKSRNSFVELIKQYHHLVIYWLEIQCNQYLSTQRVNQ